jgi:hypothetical protein
LALDKPIGSRSGSNASTVGEIGWNSKWEDKVSMKDVVSEQARQVGGNEQERVGAHRGWKDRNWIEIQGCTGHFLYSVAKCLRRQRQRGASIWTRCSNKGEWSQNMESKKSLVMESSWYDESRGITPIHFIPQFHMCRYVHLFTNHILSHHVIQPHLNNTPHTFSMWFPTKRGSYRCVCSCH